MIHPQILLWGSVSFAAAFLVHILIWRWRKPKRQIASLAAVFLLFPFLAYLAFFLHALPGSVFPWTALFAFLWHSALSSVYLMTYPPIQAGCPSLKIVLLVKNAGPAGLSADEIRGLFSKDALFEERFQDLVKDGLVSFKYDAWGITLSGRILSRFFLAYRRLLNLPLGEG